MAITIIQTPGTASGYATAARVLARAAFGLLVFGLRNFGRPAAINRRTGKVVAA